MNLDSVASCSRNKVQRGATPCSSQHLAYSARVREMSVEKYVVLDSNFIVLTPHPAAVLKSGEQIKE